MKSIGMSVSVAMVGLALGLAGCDSLRSVAGMDKQPPDEFAVVTRAPLSVPPEFGLRPPAPGTERPQEKTVRNEARDILLRNSSATPGQEAREAVSSGKFSPGEAALLSHAGALNPDPAIRLTVNRESTAIAEASTGFMDKVIFWQEAQKPGEIVDADKESRRLREARALGDAVSEGDVPVIERKRRGWLEGIF
jgi:hypothetical protein